MAFVNDTFSGESSIVDLTAHTGEVGATWTQHPSYSYSPKVDPDGFCFAGDGRSCCYASGIPATEEYDVAAYLTNPGTAMIWLGGRCSTSADTMYLVRYNGTEWQLYLREAGSSTLLGSYTQTLTTDQAYHVKLEIRNAAKKVFIDGVERILSTDNTIAAAGRVSVRYSYLGGSGTDQIDNLVATDVSTQSPTNLNFTALIYNAVQGDNL